MSPDPEQEAPRSPEDFRRLLDAERTRFDLELSPATLGRLAEYLAELDLWRRRINLTGRLTSTELAAHALESVLGANLIIHGARVVDIGSGAGFPGLPLAIAREDLDVTLVEPRAKRCTFLRHVVRTLRLEKVRVTEARIEDVGGQTFQVATTRAVGGFADWLGSTPFLEQSGLVLAWVTDTADLEGALGDGFRLARALAVPGSFRKRIAAFQRTG
jgi:16S rRNA (guanine527-N7)-methyltransferase